MVRLLVPPRQRGVEVLDVCDDPELQRRSHRDIALANRLLGGVRAVRTELEPLLDAPGHDITLLDVGTGTGDIPERLLPVARRRGMRLRVFGVDGRMELVRATREWPAEGVCADALALPFADGAFDIVLASQVLHHFPRDEAIRLLRELDRVAKRRVVIADLRRSWVAAGGLWLISFPLGFHAVSRHDGVVSILRGFDGTELAEMVREAVGVLPRVRRQFAWRLTASWSPAR